MLTQTALQAWRLQSIQGEADSVKWRGGTGDDLEDMLQEQISSREWSSDEMQVRPTPAGAWRPRSTSSRRRGGAYRRRMTLRLSTR
jgi:hypothetical protein